MKWLKGKFINIYRNVLLRLQADLRLNELNSKVDELRKALDSRSEQSERFIKSLYSNSSDVVYLHDFNHVHTHIRELLTASMKPSIDDLSLIHSLKPKLLDQLRGCSITLIGHLDVNTLRMLKGYGAKSLHIVVMQEKCGVTEVVEDSTVAYTDLIKLASHPLPPTDYVLITNPTTTSLVLRNVLCLRNLSRYIKKSLIFPVINDSDLNLENSNGFCLSESLDRFVLSEKLIRSLLHKNGFFEVALIDHSGEKEVTKFSYEKSYVAFSDVQGTRKLRQITLRTSKTKIFIAHRCPRTTS